MQTNKIQTGVQFQRTANNTTVTQSAAGFHHVGGLLQKVLTEAECIQ